jgi:hypothetical protein
MSVRQRMERYRSTGGASDLVRVEVLVPSSKRAEILARASELRARHRASKDRLRGICEKAMEHYAARILDNVDLSRLANPEQRARVIAGALMERGDGRAFILGRQILAELEPD